MAAKSHRIKPAPVQVVAARRLWLYVAHDDGWVAEQLGLNRPQVTRLRLVGGWDQELPAAQASRKADDEAFASEARRYGTEVNQRALRAALGYLELHETASGKLAAGSTAHDEDGILRALRNAPTLKEAAEVGRLVTGQTTDKTGLETDLAEQVRAMRAVLNGTDSGDGGVEDGAVDGVHPAPTPAPDPGI